jgi:hypothetical protein
MKKRAWISIVLLLALSDSVFGYPGDTLTIQIKSKGKKTYPVFNGKQFKNGCSGRLKRILGQPYEIVIRPKHFTRCKGLNGHCGTGLWSPKIVFFNYFRDGLTFSGPRRSKLEDVIIDLDTLKKYSSKPVFIEFAGFRFGRDTPSLKLDSVKARGYLESIQHPISYLVSDSIQKCESDTSRHLFRVIFQTEHILLLSAGKDIRLWFDMRLRLKRVSIINWAYHRRLGRRH